VALPGESLLMFPGTRAYLRYGQRRLLSDDKGHIAQRTDASNEAHHGDRGRQLASTLRQHADVLEAKDIEQRILNLEQANIGTP
jgi:hypothetical protein